MTYVDRIHCEFGVSCARCINKIFNYAIDNISVAFPGLNSHCTKTSVQNELFSTYIIDNKVTRKCNSSLDFYGQSHLLLGPIFPRET